MGRYSSMLRSPKEEQQVPDTITMDSKSSRMNDIDDVCPIKNDDDVINILDELESFWGVEEEDNVLVEGGGIFGDLELNFMEEWNDDDQFPIEEHQYFKEEDIDEEFYAVKHTDRFLEEGEEESPYCNVVKREILGFEEEGEKIPLNLNLNLNLNYQEVMDAWSNRGSLWAEEYSPHSMANNTFMGEVPVMEEKKTRREEKVLRYKEKRQSRLFSKKIRYQVRKLNAEKRPRLKGRFVKRVPARFLLDETHIQKKYPHGEMKETNSKSCV